jgi:hypothetical protein
MEHLVTGGRAFRGILAWRFSSGGCVVLLVQFAQSAEMAGELRQPMMSVAKLSKPRAVPSSRSESLR